nr:immunoglobulin light chain junction region [Macaca mulatta]MOV79036.1 immunoglobulin light chain junction region [Macaca mulatta]MOV80578.1 immunoglobulin light chain junction region [Macaca mulatta]MOV81304.1 immunoglobulin light chain junction region [Macaca mulatta]MOV81442.1 immunoglobulin light chain junction region [Macaca mulatta]
CQHGYGIQLTF